MMYKSITDTTKMSATQKAQQLVKDYRNTLKQKQLTHTIKEELISRINALAEKGLEEASVEIDMFGNIYFGGSIVSRIPDADMGYIAEGVNMFLRAPENEFTTKIEKGPSLVVITVEWK
jgi:hypothetical protein